MSDIPSEKTDHLAISAMSPELEDFIRHNDAERTDLVRQSTAAMVANGEMLKQFMALLEPQVTQATEADVERRNAQILQEKRDWFAGQALQGMLAGLLPNAPSDADAAPRAFHRVGFSEMAKDAYYLADAMLAERCK